MIERPELQNQPSLVIIVDAWQRAQENANYDQVVRFIRTFCERNFFCNAVALASYATDDRLIKEQPFFDSAKTLFYDSTRWGHLRHVWQQEQPVADTTSTHESILGINASHILTRFLMWHPLQLVYYCNCINPSIRNLYLMGFAWDNCLAWRSMGWKNIGTLKQLGCLPNVDHVFSDLRCTLAMQDQQVQEVTDPWRSVTKNLVELDKSIDFCQGGWTCPN